jgi:hypothetical protein
MGEGVERTLFPVGEPAVGPAVRRPHQPAILFAVDPIRNEERVAPDFNF